MPDEQDYDIAVSFAGEHRDYVERTVAAAKAAGIRVFYDRDMTVEWWGKDILVEQRKMYGSRTRYFVPFISNEYFNKPYPRDEFDAAMLTAVKQGDGYILPVLVGDVVVPAELLHPHVAYLKSHDYTPEELAEVLRRKVGAAADSGQEPRDVSSVVRSALKLPMPRIPRDYDKREELQSIYAYLLERFRDAAPQLETAGFPASVREYDLATRDGKSKQFMTFEVMRWQANVYSLHLSVDEDIFDTWLTLRVGNAYAPDVATAVPFFDVNARQARVKVTDRSAPGVLGHHKPTEWNLTKDELFDKLWARIIHCLEQA
ncbi:TIR domain-containing protein [Lentzea sp. JNUCC 0626]|uniref:TIR domain-containing protein n=1 Tax=Lentzea sp. JNUCC 0626 TaxID=3367513 RepID=UPI0037480757